MLLVSKTCWPCTMQLVELDPSRSSTIGTSGRYIFGFLIPRNNPTDLLLRTCVSKMLLQSPSQLLVEMSRSSSRISFSEAQAVMIARPNSSSSRRCRLDILRSSFSLTRRTRNETSQVVRNRTLDCRFIDLERRKYVPNHLANSKYGNEQINLTSIPRFLFSLQITTCSYTIVSLFACLRNRLVLKSQ